MKSRSRKRTPNIVNLTVKRRYLTREAKTIEGNAETVALPAPDVIADGPNNDMDAANTAMGARESKPRKRTVPSPPGG